MAAHEHSSSGSGKHQETQALFVCYPRCSTCAKARTWLDEHGIDYRERDIKTDNPTAKELAEWQQRSGLSVRRFFNTSGQLYRSLGLKDKLDTMRDKEAFDLLATDGMLVKRPIIVSANSVLVGFRAGLWKEALL
ncbi:ArsC family transcriptional regulator [Bifidobacterium aemilianum]|uniref:ArsC family transcriptional regulator n=1 Tax=Bifidobacterium aemilianum TaxID=2493120 RepID=A0A366KAG3_9BIFI|nr:arsenate reductase family protein [Bifidobacterium aemilianum]RBP98232.1 ArsC family transcriptional regulator [Bifidobacterium aemilianum]